MSSVPGWLLALTGLTCSACGEEVACTLDLRSTLTGEIRNREGGAVTPDSVVRVGPGKKRVDCYVRNGGYTCDERGAGQARVRVQLGNRSWDQTIHIRSTDDGCHDAYQQLDFTLPELTPCAGATAVEGALIDFDGSFITGASVRLQRASAWDVSLTTLVSPAVSCAVEAGRYRCDAINQYSDTDYHLSIELRGEERSAPLHVHARDCEVDTLEHDIDLRSAGAGG